MTKTASVTYATKFGEGWVAFADDEIVRTGLPGSPNPYPFAAPSPEAADLAARLSAYWEGGELPVSSAKILSRAARTVLDAAIYRTVAAIPAGETMSYSAIAKLVGRPGAARAVGAAMAANRFAPMIPCHRVVGSDGSLRGYAGGLDMKRFLLEMEAHA